MITNVTDLCEKHKMSIEQLTVKTGLDENRVRAIVFGRWTPSPSERQRVADAFGVTVDEVAWGHKTPIQHIYGHGPG